MFHSTIVYNEYIMHNGVTSMVDPLDELFGVSYEPFDTTAVEKYFSGLKQAVTDCEKTLKREEESELKDTGDWVVNEFSWFESDFDSLIQAYNEAVDVIAQYKSIVEERLTSSEAYDLNTIRVKQAMMKASKK